MEIKYFDLFEISKNVLFFLNPLRANSGCVVTVDEKQLVYFRQPQVNLEESIKAMQQKLPHPHTYYATEFSDLVHFLVAHRKQGIS